MIKKPLQICIYYLFVLILLLLTLSFGPEISNTSNSSLIWQISLFILSQQTLTKCFPYNNMHRDLSRLVKLKLQSLCDFKLNYEEFSTTVETFVIKITKNATNYGSNLQSGGEGWYCSYFQGKQHSKLYVLVYLLSNVLVSVSRFNEPNCTYKLLPSYH